MRKFFIYYSLTGNGKFLASLLEQKGYIPVQIEMKKEPKKVGFFTILKYGGRAGFNKKEKLKDYFHDFEEGDEFIIGSPIWNARPTPVLNSVLKETDFSGKKLSFVFYSGSGEGKKAKAKIEKLFPSSEIVFLKEPKKYPKELEKLGNFR